MRCTSLLAHCGWRAGLLATLPYQPLHVATVGTGLIEFSGPWGEGREYSYADAIESAKLGARAAGVLVQEESSGGCCGGDSSDASDAAPAPQVDFDALRRAAGAADA